MRLRFDDDDDDDEDDDDVDDDDDNDEGDDGVIDLRTDDDDDDDCDADADDGGDSEFAAAADEDDDVNDDVDAMANGKDDDDAVAAAVTTPPTPPHTTSSPSPSRTVTGGLDASSVAHEAGSCDVGADTSDLTDGNKLFVASPSTVAPLMRMRFAGRCCALHEFSEFIPNAAAAATPFTDDVVDDGAVRKEMRCGEHCDSFIGSCRPGDSMVEKERFREADIVDARSFTGWS
jgi:hypothetical protein